jgi:glutathione S-transferase
MSPVATLSKPKARSGGAAAKAASGGVIDAKPPLAARAAGSARAVPRKPATARKTAAAALTLSSKNYSSWSLRGWLMARFAGLDFEEVMVGADDADARQEILLLSPSIRVPCLTHDGTKVWDTLAIGEYLAEVRPASGLLPADRAARAHCRAICGEMHSGFSSLRSALPMNLKGDFPGHKVWTRALGDIDRIVAIWSECMAAYGGPFLFGKQRCIADAMYAPVVTRFLSYHVKLDRTSLVYCRQIMQMPEMIEWTAAARLEPDDIDELEMDF